MKHRNIDTKKQSSITIDPSLDVFNNKVLFPEKLEKANTMLKEIGLPKTKEA